MAEQGQDAMPRGPLRVTLVQIAAGPDPAGNRSRIEAMLAGQAPEDLLVLPEVFACRADDAGARVRAEEADGAIARWMGELARRRNAWVAGGLIERTAEGIFNTLAVVDPSGRRQAAYRKIHLFESRLESGAAIREADLYRAGRDPVVVTMEGWRVGLSICYDLRFPELFRIYAAQGAHLMLAPSNFTRLTGRDHWEILVRARAIENQVFVVAPNQCGVNVQTGVASYGHSLAVGPWGEKRVEGGDEEAVLSVVLDPVALEEARRRVPALRHRVIG